MLQKVRIINYRGLKDTTIPLAPVTLLTGANGIGKTSVLEGLYFLLSPKRPDAAVFPRYTRFSQQPNMQGTGGVSIPAFHLSYDYLSFWKESMAYGASECQIEAFSETLKLSWEANISDFSALDQEIKKIAQSYGLQVGYGVPYVLWKWRIEESKELHKEADRSIKAAQQLSFSIEPRFSPTIGTEFLNTECRYIDMSSVKYIPDKLPLQTENLLTYALKIINPNVTGVRHDSNPNRLRVIINNESDHSLGTLGVGAESWASVLLMLSELQNTSTKNELSVMFLVDEIGAGIHYSKLEEMWDFLLKFLLKYPHIQMVLTTHSNDCINAFCKTFRDTTPGMAHIVRLHKYNDKDGVKTTVYPYEMFESIHSGEWEVRG